MRDGRAIGKPAPRWLLIFARRANRAAHQIYPVKQHHTVDHDAPDVLRERTVLKRLRTDSGKGVIFEIESMSIDSADRETNVILHEVAAIDKQVAAAD